MIRLNDSYERLDETYLFAKVARKVNAWRLSHPDADIVRMDIGDVTRPICGAAIEAMHRAVADLAAASTFHGYGPEQGYAFLREAIAAGDYAERGIDISPDEIFIGDGAKSDIGNFPDILSAADTVALTDPVYPVYADTNVMGGRKRFISLPMTTENGFVPCLPEETPDVVYLCFPNNPTGTLLPRENLRRWVDYCRANGVLLLFDSAYEAYVRTPGAVRSIFEIEGAREVAVEFRSFSKTAGFTGLRCGYTVVPKDLTGRFSDSRKGSLHDLWLRRQTTKFNGASYIVQRAAEALYTPEGREACRVQTDSYIANASLLRESALEAGLYAVGGQDSPYVWVKAPGGMDSWSFFDRLLELGITSTPGSGFGKSGEGFVRLTGFNSEANTREAIERLRRI